MSTSFAEPINSDELNVKQLMFVKQPSGSYNMYGYMTAMSYPDKTLKPQWVLLKRWQQFQFDVRTKNLVIDDTLNEYETFVGYLELESIVNYFLDDYNFIIDPDGFIALLEGSLINKKTNTKVASPWFPFICDDSVLNNYRLIPMSSIKDLFNLEIEKVYTQSNDEVFFVRLNQNNPFTESLKEVMKKVNK